MFFQKSVNISDLYIAKANCVSADAAHATSYQKIPKTPDEVVDYEIERSVARKNALVADRKYEKLLNKYRKQNGLD